MTTIEAWGLKLEPGKPHKFTLIPDDEPSALLRITNASLTENIVDPNGRTLVKVTKKQSMLLDDTDDEDAEPKLEEFILCSLTPGKIEQAMLMVEFSSDLIQLEVIGKNEIHLLGNIIDQEVGGPSDDFDSDDDISIDDNDAYRLEDVSSDVAVDETTFDFEDESDEDGDASRFEELVDQKSLKRSADAMDEDGVNGSELSKKQKKKLAKKLKNEAGAPIAVTATTATTTTTSTVTATGTSPDSKKTKDEKQSKGDKKPKDNKNEKPGEKKEKASTAPGETKTLPNGIVVLDSKKGEGKNARKGNTLSMRYIGKLENGKMFDQNVGGKPFTFHLGKGEVIKGWDEGLVGMQVGGERVLTIPPEMAYGKKGSPPDIPPNSTLRFEVKLLNIK